MFSQPVVYSVLSLALMAIAATVHLRSTQYHLPLPPALTILVTILPMAAFLVTVFHQTPSNKQRNNTTRTCLATLRPMVFQVLQALATTILATLLAEETLPSQVLDCRMDTRWMSMFRAHDAQSIRWIQDALNCCGLNSVKDRAYPFPSTSPSSCAETFGRTQACKGPWESTLQTFAGVDLAVVVAVGLMQLFKLLYGQQAPSWWQHWTAWSRNRNMAADFQDSRRPLLTSTPHVEVTSEDVEPHTQGYGSTDEESTGPRIEPSPLNGGNEWSRV